MDNTTVFSKTGKGLLEVKNRSNRISKEQYRVLSLIDGKANMDELADRARMNPTALRQILTQLTDGGFVKVLVSSTANDAGLGAGAATGSYYVDDLDFTAVLGPAGAQRPSIYQSTETERRQRESSERKAAEAAAQKKREEEDRRKLVEAARIAKEEAAGRQLREEAERKARLEAQRVSQLEAEIKARMDSDRKLKEVAAAKARAEADARIKAELDRQIREANLRKQQEEEALRRKEEEARSHREAEMRVKREAEERRRQEAEARKRKEEEERLRREAEEKARLEAEERRRQEAESLKRKEEEERRRREAEERARKEADAARIRDEEARKREEEAARLRQLAEEQARRDQAERERIEALAEQKRLEEEVRKRKSEKRRRDRAQPDDDFKDLAIDVQGASLGEEDAWLLREIGVSPQDALSAPGSREIHAGRSGSYGAANTSPGAIADETRRETDLRPAALLSESAGFRGDRDERPLDDGDSLSLKAEIPLSVGDRDAFSVVDADSLSVGAAAVDLPEVSEVVNLREATEPDFDAGVKLPIGGILEVDIRRALEEQERRLRLEDEARAALEHAELEAQAKAEREAREIAETAERARRDEALRNREEADRLAREEKERRELEEEERRHQREVDRRAREQARQEAERRKREDDLARQRKEQEEREQRKAERERVQKEIRRSGSSPARVGIAIVVVVLLVVGLTLQFASLSAWAPDAERVASQRLGEPVRIASLRLSLMPRFELVLENVTVGVAQDVHANTVVVSPRIGSLFSERKAFDEVHIKGVTGSVEALARAGNWLKGLGGKPELVSVPIIRFSDITLSIPGVTLPNVNATVKLGQGGQILGAFAATSDERLEVDFMPRESDVEVSVRGRNFTMPVGPSVEVMDLQGKGTLLPGQLTLAGVEYFLLGGQGSADVNMSWRDGWFMETNFELKRLSLDASMRAMKIQLISEGSLDAKGVARMRSQQFEKLFERPEISANFTVSRGNLAGMDLPRALQQRSREGVQGGQTRFEEFSGVLQTREGAHQFRSVKLKAGVLKASGQADISAAGNISGRLQAELRSSAGAVRGGFTLSGNDQAMSLKQ